MNKIILTHAVNDCSKNVTNSVVVSFTTSASHSELPASRPLLTNHTTGSLPNIRRPRGRFPRLRSNSQTTPTPRAMKPNMRRLLESSVISSPSRDFSALAPATSSSWREGGREGGGREGEGEGGGRGEGRGRRVKAMGHQSLYWSLTVKVERGFFGRNKFLYVGKTQITY